MSRQSEAVKRWRRSIKEKAVLAFGGKCELCGYSACVAALEFHHLDPSKKEFHFSHVIAKPKNIKKVQEELNKCALVCSNCHKEIHFGVRSIPDTVLKNRPNVTLAKIVPQKEYDSCPVCGKPKATANITCSRECAAKRARKIDWNSIDLKKELETKSMCKIAEMLGISEAAVRKRRQKLGL